MRNACYVGRITQSSQAIYNNYDLSGIFSLCVVLKTLGDCSLVATYSEGL